MTEYKLVVVGGECARRRDWPARSVRPGAITCNKASGWEREGGEGGEGGEGVGGNVSRRSDSVDVHSCQGYGRLSVLCPGVEWCGVRVVDREAAASCNHVTPAPLIPTTRIL